MQNYQIWGQFMVMPHNFYLDGASWNMLETWLIQIITTDFLSSDYILVT
jgi:hypothetical protein